MFQFLILDDLVLRLLKLCSLHVTNFKNKIYLKNNAAETCIFFINFFGKRDWEEGDLFNVFTSVVTKVVQPQPLPLTSPIQDMNRTVNKYMC